jgi:hypothetical protein
MIVFNRPCQKGINYREILISGDFDFRSVALKGVNLRTTYSMNEAVASLR